MINETWWDLMRWGNVALASISVALLTATTIRRWDLLPKRIRRISVWFILILAVTAYGSGEAATQEVPPGYRVLLMLLALAGLIVTILYRFNDDLDE